MIIFADTSAFYALLVRDDIMHVRAKKCFDYFSENAVQLFSTSFVILETVALLRRRIGLEAVQDFNNRIIPLLEILWVNEDWYRRGFQKLQSVKNKNISLVDCISFEIMEARSLSIAFTYDKHFKENGFSIASFDKEK
jgi:predicted nucleic acid-binding protein